MTQDVIEVRGVTRTFGEVQAVNGISLTVRKGEMFGLIGHNGAGKSTLFKMLLGLLPVTAGEIEINGVSTASPGFREVRRGIGYLPENFVTYDNLTGRETLRLFADLKGGRPDSVEGVLEQVGLDFAAGRRVRSYSKGMRQRLGFAQALLGNPGLLFLDEPTNGLDPEGIHDFYQILRQLQEQGTTIIITSHILAEIQQRVDRLVILNGGKIEAQGTLADLRARMHLPSVIRITLRPGTAVLLERQLAHLDEVELELGEGQASIACHAGQKIAVLNALAGLDDLALDVSIHEPSLEDVFFGYGGPHAHQH